MLVSIIAVFKSCQFAFPLCFHSLNYIDLFAAIAANAMEGVVEPMMNGMGGDLMAIVYDSSKPKGKRLSGINSSGRSSKSTSIAEMRSLIAQATKGLEKSIPLKGPLPVSVPGAVMGWCEP